MSIRTLLMVMALFLATFDHAQSLAVTEDYAVEKDEWLVIPVTVPEKKAGGGDFYTVLFEPLQSGDVLDHLVKLDEVRVRSQSPGVYSFRILINHITKSSCGGVEVKEYSSTQFRLMVN